MQRYSRYTEAETVEQPDGDATFLGVNTKTKPWLLKPGILQDGINLTFQDGAATTRRGIYNIVSHRTTATRYYGSGIWSDPDGLEWLLVVEATKVWRCRQGWTPISYDLPSTETLAENVVLVQAFNRMLMFRPSGATLQWDGSGDWTPVDRGTTPPTQPIPGGVDKHGLVPVLMNGRLVVPYGRTSVAISDLSDYTQYDAAYNDYNLTTGNDDSLTALYPYANSGLLCFKDQSIALLDGLTGDLSQLQLLVINRELGCVAGNTIAQLGGDVLFLSSRGVFRVQQVIQDRISTAPVPVSDPMEKYIRRINGSAAQLSCAAVWGENYYLAVPLDTSARPNAILVYDATNGEWQGVHTFPTGVAFDALRVSDDINGQKVLYAVDHTNARTFQMYLTCRDRVDATESEITTSFKTRAMMWGDAAAHKTARMAQVSWQTWAAQPTIKVEPDGVNETLTPGRYQNSTTSFTYDRTKYRIWSKPDYVATNANNDHAVQGREDYSVVPGSTIILGTNGVDFGLMQTHHERVSVRAHARHAALVVENAQGRLSISATAMAASESDRAQRRTP